MPGRIMALAAAKPPMNQTNAETEADEPSGWNNAVAVMMISPNSKPIIRPDETGRANRHTNGTPPSVNPMNRLYMIQRWLTTNSLVGPANNRIVSPADSRIGPIVNSAETRSLNRVISEIARIKCGYTPLTNSMVPPLMPGTRFANPIKTPPKIPLKRGTRLVDGAIGTLLCISGNDDGHAGLAYGADSVFKYVKHTRVYFVN